MIAVLKVKTVSRSAFSPVLQAIQICSREALPKNASCQEPLQIWGFQPILHCCLFLNAAAELHLRRNKTTCCNISLFLFDFDWPGWHQSSLVELQEMPVDGRDLNMITDDKTEPETDVWGHSSVDLLRSWLSLIELSGTPLADRYKMSSLTEIVLQWIHIRMPTLKVWMKMESALGTHPKLQCLQLPRWHKFPRDDNCGGCGRWVAFSI